MTFACPHCKQLIEADAEHSGQTDSCPCCNGLYVIPGAQPGKHPRKTEEKIAYGVLGLGLLAALSLSIYVTNRPRAQHIEPLHAAESSRAPSGTDQQKPPRPSDYPKESSPGQAAAETSATPTQAAQSSSKPTPKLVPRKSGGAAPNLVAGAKLELGTARVTLRAVAEQRNSPALNLSAAGSRKFVIISFKVDEMTSDGGLDTDKIVLLDAMGGEVGRGTGFLRADENSVAMAESVKKTNDMIKGTIADVSGPGKYKPVEGPVRFERDLELNGLIQKKGTNYATLGGMMIGSEGGLAWKDWQKAKKLSPDAGVFFDVADDLKVADCAIAYR